MKKKNKKKMKKMTIKGGDKNGKVFSYLRCPDLIVFAQVQVTILQQRLSTGLLALLVWLTMMTRRQYLMLKAHRLIWRYEFSGFDR